MIAGGAEAAITPFAYASFASMKVDDLTRTTIRSGQLAIDLNATVFEMAKGAGVLCWSLMSTPFPGSDHRICRLCSPPCDAYHITQLDPEGKGHLAMKRAIVSRWDGARVDRLHQRSRQLPRLATTTSSVRP